jgi:hypothetical protein
MIFQNFGFNRQKVVSPSGPPVDATLKLWLDAGNASSYSGTGTTWYDLTSNGNNLTLNGSPAYDATTGSFYFPDDNSKYAVSTTLSNTTTAAGIECSWEMWHRYKGPVDDNYYCPVMWGTKVNDGVYNDGGLLVAFADSGFNGYAMETSMGGQKLQYNIPNFGATAYWNKTTAYNVWINHVMVRKADDTTEVYVNAISIGTSTYGGEVPTATQIYVGTNDPSFPFGGQLAYYGDISTCKLWVGKALTSTEITNNFNATKARYGY